MTNMAVIERHLKYGIGVHKLYIFQIQAWELSNYLHRGQWLFYESVSSKPGKYVTDICISIGACIKIPNKFVLLGLDGNWQ